MATKLTPNADLLTWSPTALLAAVRNVFPHLINPDGGEGQAETIRNVLAKFDVLEIHLGRYEKFIEILQATTWFEGIHPDQALAVPTAQAPVVSELDRLKNELVQKLNDPHVKDIERNKMLAGLNRLDTVEKVQGSLDGLTAAIADRQAAANAELAGAHEDYDGGQKEALLQDAFPDETRQQPETVDELVQALKDGKTVSPGVVNGEPALVSHDGKKPRAKKAKAEAEPVTPAVDVSDPDNLAPTGQEGQMIDPECGLGGTNLYASLDQKKKLLKLAIDPKVTNNERSKLYLGINKISYADAERSLEKMRGWIKDRPTAPTTARPPVPPATDPAPVGSVAPAYDPEKMPFQQD